jgi:PAS domain S-box-containing protein
MLQQFRFLGWKNTAVVLTASIVATGAVLALIGWLINSEGLKRGFIGAVPINPTTAIVFLATSAALAMLGDECRYQARGSITLALGALIAASGLLLLGRYFTPADIALDRLLFRERLGDNRMAPNTACQFVLTGLSLLMLGARRPRWQKAGQTLAILLAIGTSVSLIGYAYGTRHLYGIGSYIPMALNTAALFGVVAIGLIAARPEQSIFAVLADDRAGGRIARRLLPAAILIPVLLGFLRLVGQRAGWYDTEFGTSLLVIATAVLLVAAILVTAATANRMDVQRLQAEQALRGSEARLRLLLAGVVDYAIIMLDREGYVMTWNPGAERLLGFQSDEIVGRHFSLFYPPEAIERNWPAQELKIAQSQGRVEDENWRVRKDGTCFWANGVIAAIYDERGQLQGFSKVTRDLTERKEAEKAIQRLNDELEARVQERTAELAEANRDLKEKNQENEMFVYSVSHDLRSPLVSLQGFSKELGLVGTDLRSLLSAEEVPAAVRNKAHTLIDGDMQESLRFIQTGVLRLSNIIDALLRLSRVGRVEYEYREVNAAVTVRRVVDSMSVELFERGVEVRVHDLPSCYGDATAIEQLFANLIGNALKYLDSARPGEIEVGALPPSTDAPEDGRTQTYYVKDNGLGVPAACQQKIFQAFQRVHPRHAPGEGMGLAIVRRIVERHRGRVWVESSEGQGSTFFVTLPACGVAVQTLPANARPKSGGKTNGQPADGDLVGGRR